VTNSARIADTQQFSVEPAGDHSGVGSARSIPRGARPDPSPHQPARAHPTMTMIDDRGRGEPQAAQQSASHRHAGPPLHPPGPRFRSWSTAGSHGRLTTSPTMPRMLRIRQACTATPPRTASSRGRHTPALGRRNPSDRHLTICVDELPAPPRTITHGVDGRYDRTWAKCALIILASPRPQPSHLVVLSGASCAIRKAFRFTTRGLGDGVSPSLARSAQD